VLLLALAAAPEPRAQTTTPSGDTPNAVAPEGADGLPRRVALRFLTDNDYPPFNYLDADGVLTGFNIDLARALCLELSAACDIKTRPWNEMLLAVKKGEADAVIASHAVTPRLVAELGVTDRYYHTPGRFAGKRGVAYGATPEGLDGKRIGVAKGTAHEAYVRQFFTLSPVQTFETVELARDALVTGAVDVLFDDGISLVFWLNGTASKACCEFKGGAYFEPKYFGDGVGIIVGKDDLQLKALFNAALKKVRDNGRYEELVLKYFPLRAY
jgi:polar amino acid transport system substrate-binding protein